MGDCGWLVISSVDWDVPYLMEKKTLGATGSYGCGLCNPCNCICYVPRSLYVYKAKENRCGDQRCQAPFRVVWKNKRGSFRENSGCHPQVSIAHNRNAGNDKQGTARTRDKE